LQQLYQDSMAVIRAHGKPDLFITMTCNPNWPEIKNELIESQNAHKLTIIARVFKIKLKCLLDDLFNKKIFGKTKAHMYVIEFQKRGLPHAHILLILNDDDKLHTCDDYDSIVSAELPDPDKHPELFLTVTSCMLHGPCGHLNPNAPCMVEDNKGYKVCSKGFPKSFCQSTQQNEDGYPEYRRRDNGIVFKKTVKNPITHKSEEISVDNRWVVPYNPHLTAKYNCHINVEVCSSVQAVKYLYKYIYKGPDKAQTTFEPILTDSNSNSIQNTDEIKEYVDARYISAIEAVWHIFHFLMHEQDPSVIRLDFHLKNEHSVY
jgi:hypothetical protein